MDRESRIKSVLSRWYGSRLGVFLESIFIGVLSGFVVVFFRVALEKAEEFRDSLFRPMRAGDLRVIVFFLIALVTVGLLLGWMSVRRPMIKGSGIPQIKGALLRKMRLEWLPELPMKIIGGVLGIGFGLSLGREGPSVQIGAYVGKATLSIARRPALERKYLITGGAAAGLAAAFNAPLAGVLFALEELHRHFSPLLLACTMGASIAGDLVASRFFGLRQAFDFHTIIPLPMERFPLILLLGVICALGGDLFKRALYGAQDAYVALRIPQTIRPLVALLIVLPFGLFMFDVTGGGHNLIEELSKQHFAVNTLLALFAGKLFLTVMSYGSGAPGGIFLPLLACGALIGEAFGNVLSYIYPASVGENLNYMIIGMAAFFTGVVKAPVTGAVLILEMSGNFNHFAGLAAGCMAAFVTGDLIGSRSVYDALLDRLLKRNPSLFRPTHGRKVLIDVPIAAGSLPCDRAIGSLDWPRECLIVGVQRGDAELIPDGSTELHEGDILVVLVPEESVAEIKETLLDLGSSSK